MVRKSNISNRNVCSIICLSYEKFTFKCFWNQYLLYIVNILIITEYTILNIKFKVWINNIHIIYINKNNF